MLTPRQGFTVNVIVALPLDGIAKPGTGAGIETTVVPALIGSKNVCFVSPVPPWNAIGLAVTTPTAGFELAREPCPPLLIHRGSASPREPRTLDSDAGRVNRRDDGGARPERVSNGITTAL
jgi:hypothetical protein